MGKEESDKSTQVTIRLTEGMRELIDSVAREMGSAPGVAAFTRGKPAPTSTAIYELLTRGLRSWQAEHAPSEHAP